MHNKFENIYYLKEIDLLSLNTLDIWRQRRMYECIDPFIKGYPNARWLTVGDGRYGTDAHYLRTKKCDVVASDIDVSRLRQAKKRGYIQSFLKEDAEKLSLKDNAFDFVLCKESMHHFSRPYLGLYEMLRVAKDAVILIEPNDIFHNRTAPQYIFWWLKKGIKSLFGIYEKTEYETVGNYVFRISQEEIIKIAIALNYPCVVTKEMNDLYEPGGEYIYLNRGFRFHLLRFKIGVLDILSYLGLHKPNILFHVIFKRPLTDHMKNELKDKRYSVSILPQNPYKKSFK